MRLMFIHIAALCVAALTVAGCGAWDPGVTHHDPIKSTFELTVVDIHGQPVRGASAHCGVYERSLLLRDTTLTTGSDGVCAIEIPIVPDSVAILHRTFETSMKYTVEAQGFVPSSGEVLHGLPLYSSDMHPDVKSTSASQSVTLYTETDYLDESYATSLDAGARSAVAALIDSLAAKHTLAEVKLQPHGFRLSAGGDTLEGAFFSGRLFNTERLSPRDVARAFFVDGYVDLLPALVAFADAHGSNAALVARASCQTQSFDDRSSPPGTLSIRYVIPSATVHTFLAKKIGMEELLKALAATVDGAPVALESR